MRIPIVETNWKLAEFARDHIDIGCKLRFCVSQKDSIVLEFDRDLNRLDKETCPLLTSCALVSSKVVSWLSNSTPAC